MLPISYDQLRALLTAIALTGYNANGRCGRDDKVEEALADATAILIAVGVESVGFMSDRVDINEAVRVLGISRAQLYKRIAAGDIPIQKDGKRTFLLTEDLNRYIGKRARAGRRP